MMDSGADNGMRRRRRSPWQTVSWSPASASIAPNRSYRAPGTPGGRDFAPTEHLAPEAVAAFVDGELSMTPHMRAARHLAMCPECAGAVEAQGAARARLRDSGQVSIPAGLLGQLAQIPTREFDLPGARGASGDEREGCPSESRTAPLDVPGFPVHGAGAPGVGGAGAPGVGGAGAPGSSRSRGPRWWSR